jgi:hypothetical protein
VVPNPDHAVSCRLGENFKVYVLGARVPFVITPEGIAAKLLQVIKGRAAILPVYNLLNPVITERIRVSAGRTDLELKFG